MLIFLRFIHLVSLVVWIGGIIFFSFIAAPSIFKILPRETAGDVVGEIFPKYWVISYICSITALATIMIVSSHERTYAWVRIGLLVLMTGLAFYSGLIVGSKARKVKAEIRTTQDPSKKEGLKSQFKILHRNSAILNGIILILGVMLIFLTATSLKI